MKINDQKVHAIAGLLAGYGVESDLIDPAPDPSLVARKAYFRCFPHYRFSDWSREENELRGDANIARNQCRKLAAWCDAALELDELDDSQKNGLEYASAFFTAKHTLGLNGKSRVSP